MGVRRRIFRARIGEKCDKRWSGICYVSIYSRRSGQMLYSIGIEQMETFLGKLAFQVSPHTARRAHDVLRKMLQDAKRWAYITENPAWDAERPRPPHREMHVLSIEEASRLIREMPAPWRPLVLTALLTGCRWGELAGLLWTDADLDSRRLHVRRQIAANTTEPAAPKSRRGIRTIDLLPPVRQALLDLPQRGTLVFPGARGGSLDHHNFMHRVWSPTIRALGLRVRFHDCRHFFASLLLAWDEPLLYAAGQLGHASADITLRVYGHLIQEGRRLDREETLRRFAEAFRPGATELRPNLSQPAAEEETGRGPEPTSHLRHRRSLLVETSGFEPPTPSLRMNPRPETCDPASDPEGDEYNGA